MSRAAAIVDKLLEDEFDARQWFLTPPAGTGRRIRISYSIVTPESAEMGDAAEHGWVNEEGEEMDPDEYDFAEGITAAQKATKFLNDSGAIHPSSSHFHPGVWYSAQGEMDTDGNTEERSFHLHGFTPEEEQEIFNEVALKI